MTDQTSYAVDAQTFARAWLSVALASGKDLTSPLLDKTVAIEAHADGVLLVATDRYVLLSAWVPRVEKNLAPPPEVSELPAETYVAADPDGRCRGLLNYVLDVQSREGAKPASIILDLGVTEPDDDPQGFFDGMDLQWVVMSYPNHERLRLGTVAGQWAQWRGLVAEFKGKRTWAIALNPEIVGRLAKLGRLHPGPLLWEFGGVERAAKLQIGGEETPLVSGVVMPVRYGFDDEDTPE